LVAAAYRRLIVALDFPRLAPALAMARRLAGTAGMFKVGNQLFTAEGPLAVKKLAGFGAGIFLDLKFHDIPNTVASSVAAAARLPGVRLINLHALGGLEMMRAGASALPSGRNRPKLLAVTILTSLDAAKLRQLGISSGPKVCAVRLARLAQKAGLDGVVTSGQEVAAIRRACGSRFLIVALGIRPASAAANDQERIATPEQAIRAGADYLGVGRPITAAPDPRAAASRIVQEISRGLDARV
jgi:orotidine-5'-phosphate decarboxylase